MELKGKTVLITGSARRLGRAIALRLAGRGANIAAHYLNSRNDALSLKAELESLHGVKAEIFQADLTRAGEIHAAIDSAVETFGGLDVLINNAAVYFKTPFESLDEAVWDSVMGPNLKGVFLASKRAADHMLKREGGKIVNIGDWAANRPRKDYIAYAASKAGVVSLTQSLALALAPKIQVNCVAPGAVLAPENPDDRDFERAISRTPLGRPGSPGDVAAVVQFLLEDGGFVTGAVYHVDGGRALSG